MQHPEKKSRKRNLTLNNAKLNDAVEQQQALIEQQLRDIEAKDNINKLLQENNAKLTADLEVANEKFNKINASGDRRDVGNLALSKSQKYRTNRKQKTTTSPKVF